MGHACVCYNLRQATRTVTQLYDRHLKPVDLRITQLTLLAVVNYCQPVNVGRLARYAVMDRTTVTRNLGPLERRGLIRVEPGDDRRERLVSLTKGGVEILRQAYPLWRQAQEEVVGELGRDRWDQVRGGLADLVSLCRKG
ncbi:MAG: MarR family winged helix-turn-helix transcriptional regulator [Proteobacteria bacterium]|nr:MarR family winged helix-turn-helix transcriptional regulator [Pseudomonadota bacterium]MBU1740831.1 MarR family winged helix-turn-helix transcriptional regulator [Pseudomonadota bacterium]